MGDFRDGTYGGLLVSVMLLWQYVAISLAILLLMADAAAATLHLRAYKIEAGIIISGRPAGKFIFNFDSLEECCAAALYTKDQYRLSFIPDCIPADPTPEKKNKKEDTPV